MRINRLLRRRIYTVFLTAVLVFSVNLTIHNANAELIKYTVNFQRTVGDLNYAPTGYFELDPSDPNFGVPAPNPIFGRGLNNVTVPFESWMFSAPAGNVWSPLGAFNESNGFLAVLAFDSPDDNRSPTSYPLWITFAEKEWGVSHPSLSGNIANGTYKVVSEPTTMLLLGVGLVGLAGFGRKKFKK